MRSDPGQCEECKGEGLREVYRSDGLHAGADVMLECEHCEGTGKRHEDCDFCGKRYKFEDGSGVVCGTCVQAENDRRQQLKDDAECREDDDDYRQRLRDDDE